MLQNIRPAWVALACLGLWFVQLVLTGLVFQSLGPLGHQAQRVWEIGIAGASFALGGLLLAQLPRALRWRPRRHPRPSAEVRAERQRIARDLHDHLGSQLLCTLALLDAAPLRTDAAKQALQKCMLDLRLIVDSMDSQAEPLPDRLARLRYRMQPALAQRGIRMAWDIGASVSASAGAGSGEPAALPPEKAAHVAAIVQEALSNVLQHSAASAVWVTVAPCNATGAWQVEVRDNGKGLPAGPAGAEAGSGRGIEGMRARAQLAGGSLEVICTPQGGCTVRAAVPV